MISGRDVLLTEKRDHIYILTINREERMNSLNSDLFDRFAEEMETFNESDDLWVAIVTGKGEKAFCAGMDLQEFTDKTSTGQKIGPSEARRTEHPFVPTWKPLIAAVNGHAVAGGWQMAQRCDLRVAADTAKLGVTEAKWNLPGPFAAEMGVFPTAAVAAEIVLLAEPVSAQRAYEMGFVNKVVPASEVMAQAIAWAEHICTLGQESVRGHKQLMYYGRFTPPSEIWQISKDIFYWGGNKPGVVIDSTVGSRAFVEKRAPDYSEMFHPARLQCVKCGSEYVMAKDHRVGPVLCCGEEVTVVTE